jgi:hypothetical protein
MTLLPYTTLFLVRAWGGEYREELILNDSIFAVGSERSNMA